MKTFVLFTLCLVASVCSAYGGAIDRLEANRKEMEVAGNELINAYTEVMRMETGNVDNSVISSLQDALSTILERINTRVAEHKKNAAELLEKAKDIARRLKELHADLGPKARDLMAKWTSGISAILRKLVDQILASERSKRSILESNEDVLARVVDLRKFYEKLRDSLKVNANSADAEELKKQLDNVKQELDKALSEYLERILMPIKNYNITKRSVDTEENDIMNEIVSNESDNLITKIINHLSGRYSEFISFIRDIYEKILSKVKSRHERLVAIAKEIIADSKDLHKETLREALEILEPYKKELGNLYQELVDAVNKALSRRD